MSTAIQAKTYVALQNFRLNLSFPNEDLLVENYPPQQRLSIVGDGDHLDGWHLGLLLFI